MSDPLLAPAAPEPLSVRIAATHAAPVRRGRPLLIALAVAGMAATTSMLAAGVVIFSGAAPPHAARQPISTGIGSS